MGSKSSLLLHNGWGCSRQGLRYTVKALTSCRRPVLLHHWLGGRLYLGSTPQPLMLTAVRALFNTTAAGPSAPEEAFVAVGRTGHIRKAQSGVPRSTRKEVIATDYTLYQNVASGEAGTADANDNAGSTRVPEALKRRTAGPAYMTIFKVVTYTYSWRRPLASASSLTLCCPFTTHTTPSAP